MGVLKITNNMSELTQAHRIEFNGLFFHNGEICINVAGTLSAELCDVKTRNIRVRFFYLNFSTGLVGALDSETLVTPTEGELCIH